MDREHKKILENNLVFFADRLDTFKVIEYTHTNYPTIINDKDRQRLASSAHDRYLRAGKLFSHFKKKGNGYERLYDVLRATGHSPLVLRILNPQRYEEEHPSLEGEGIVKPGAIKTGCRGEGQQKLASADPMVSSSDQTQGRPLAQKPLPPIVATATSMSTAVGNTTIKMANQDEKRHDEVEDDSNIEGASAGVVRESEQAAQHEGPSPQADHSILQSSLDQILASMKSLEELRKDIHHVKESQQKDQHGLEESLKAINEKLDCLSDIKENMRSIECRLISLERDTKASKKDQENAIATLRKDVQKLLNSYERMQSTVSEMKHSKETERKLLNTMLSRLNELQDEFKYGENVQGTVKKLWEDFTSFKDYTSVELQRLKERIPSGAGDTDRRKQELPIVNFDSSDDNLSEKDIANIAPIVKDVWQALAKDLNVPTGATDSKRGVTDDEGHAVDVLTSWLRKRADERNVPSRGELCDILDGIESSVASRLRGQYSSDK